MREPVAIVGNGPVGATAALLLARWGIASVILDTREAPRAEGSRAICQQRDVLDVWDAVGVAQELLARGVTWHTARTTYRGADLFHVRLPSSSAEDRFPPFVNISQTRTEAALHKAVQQCPLVRVCWGSEVVAVKSLEHTAELVLKAPRGKQGAVLREQRLEALYVVLACGSGGEALRSGLGVGFPGRTYDDRFLICDVRAELPHWADERRFDFDPPWNPGRQVLIHPQPEGVFRIDWQVGEDFDLDAERRDGGLHRRIREVVGEATPYELVWSSSYRFEGRCATRLRSGRVLLAGDCAHRMAPFGARGLNSGVHDAENLAWKLAFVLKGWAGDALLDSYHHERWSAAQENLRITEETMRFLVPRTDEQRRRREEILSAVLADPGDPALRSRVDSGRLYESSVYDASSSPLTSVTSRRLQQGAAGHLPGALLPDLSDRRGTALRPLARQGILVLAGPDCGPPDVARWRREIPCEVTWMASARARRGRTSASRSISWPSGSAELCARLGVAPQEALVVRPDAHIAGFAGSTSEALEIVRRAIVREP